MVEMMRRIIAVFTGDSGAGKSTLARMLASERDLPVFAAGGFERDYAKSLGYDDVVEFERKLGLEKAYYRLIGPMLESISMQDRGRGIIVEGVYDPRLYTQISGLFVEPTFLINVTAPLYLKMLRAAEKQNISPDKVAIALAELDAQKELVGKSDLAKMANITVVNDRNVEQTYELLTHAIKELLRSG